jgi:F-type H+-transporting ATPase subunit c
LKLLIEDIGGELMLTKGLYVVAILGLLAAPALAMQSAEEKEKAAAAERTAVRSSTENVEAKRYLGLALGFGLAIAAFGGAISQSNAIGKAVDAVARQPEAGARIQTMMIIGLALIETLVIYMLLICFMWGGKVAP